MFTRLGNATAAVCHGVQVGVPPVPVDSHLPSVLVVMMGPYPMKLPASNGRTTLDATTQAAARVGASLVFVPDMISPFRENGPEGKDKVDLEVFALLLTAMRNEGIRMAEESGYDYLVLLDNDVRLAPDTLFRLLQHGAGLILPRLTYPTFPEVEWLCYWPSRASSRGRLAELNWAAHSCMVWQVNALRTMRHPVFQGYEEEGKDHAYWRSHGVQPVMDMDTPVNVLDVPYGFQGTVRHSQAAHSMNGQPCPGRPARSTEGDRWIKYKCDVEGCGYELGYPAKGLER